MIVNESTPIGVKSTCSRGKDPAVLEHLDLFHDTFMLSRDDQRGLTRGRKDCDVRVDLDVWVRWVWMNVDVRVSLRVRVGMGMRR